MSFGGMIRQLLIWLRAIRSPDFSARITPIHPTPQDIKPGQMVIVGESGSQKWACFQCPGGCGETILLSLNKKQNSSWTAFVDRLERPTIHPSIRQLNECRCHFWIQQGIVEWCSDSER